MTALRAVGVRISYAGVPPTVTRWVEEVLGSAVISYADQVGGMSPGCAARLVCADGTRAFVKAVGADLNPHTPTLFGREIAVLELIGEHPLWARLRAAYDDGDWVALVLEDIDGRHPDLADDAVMGRLLEATDELGVVLGERTTGAVEGAGGTYDSGLTSQRSIFHQFATALDTLADHPDAPVPAWVRADAPTWAARTRTLGEDPMSALVHYDIRIDNLLQRTTGEIVFLDWGAAGIGPDWLDPLLARLERVDQDWFDISLASSGRHHVAGRNRHPPGRPVRHRRRRQPADAAGVPAYGVCSIPRRGRAQSRPVTPSVHTVVTHVTDVAPQPSHP